MRLGGEKARKRVVEFSEWLCAEVLKFVPHRQRPMARRLKPLSFTTIHQLLAWMITCLKKQLLIFYALKADLSRQGDPVTAADLSTISPNSGNSPKHSKTAWVGSKQARPWPTLSNKPFARFIPALPIRHTGPVSYRLARRRANSRLYRPEMKTAVPDFDPASVISPMLI